MAIIWGSPRPIPVSSIDYFIIAGGGGGGDGAGGGAGGMLYNSSFPVSPGSSYLITVGAGGANGTTTSGVNGNNSIIAGNINYDDYGVYFDGSNDRLTIGYSSLLDITQGDFTIDVWIYPSQANGQIMVQRPSSGTAGWNLRLHTDSTIQFWYTGGTVFNTPAVTLNQWIHLACVRNGTTYTTYVNGVSATSGTIANGVSVANTVNFYIGTNEILGGNFKGYMSNLRIVKGTAVYTDSFTPPTLPLTAITNTSLLTCQSSTFIDSSTNNFSLVANDNVAVVRTAPFTLRPTGHYSNYFDGSGDYMTVPANAGFQFGTGNFTIEFWQNYTSLTNYQTIVSSGYVAGLVSNGWVVQTDIGNGRIYFYYLSASSANVVAGETTGTISTGVWYHIAIVKNGSTIKIYRNGVNVGTGVDNNNYVANAQVVIGGGSSTGFNNYWVNGYLSNLRIIKGTALYISDFIPPVSPLTAISGTSLLTCQNNSFVDNSTNNFTITNNGNTIPFNLNPFESSIAYGGGGGGTYNGGATTAGLTGGSGGGGPVAGTSQGKAAGLGILGQGHNGGAGWAQDGGGAGGGGGGSGNIGGNAAVNIGGKGGIGSQLYISNVGNSVYFDGTNDYATQSSNAAYGYGTGDFTIEFWLYLSSIAADRTLVSNLTSSSSTNPHLYFKTSDNRIYYYTANANRITGDVLRINTWYHIAVSRSSGSTKLFVNGIQSGATYSDNNNYGSTAPLGIATYWSGGSPVTSGLFNGYISNLRVVKGTAVYTSDFVPSTSPLTVIVNTSVLTCQSSTFIDNSGNNLTITQYGNPKIKRLGPFNILGTNSYSVLFNNSYLSASNTITNFGTNDFTIECWIYTLAVDTSIDTIISNYNTGSTNALGLYINRGSSGGVQFYCGNSLILNAATAIPFTNSWIHVAVAKNSNTIRLFINGNLATSNSDNNDYQIDANVLNIGAATNNNVYGNYLNGYISNLRIVNGTGLYTSNFTPNTAPLTAITNTVLLTCQDNVFKDNSTNNFSITVNNSSISIDNPFLENTYYAAGGGGTGGTIYGIGGIGGGGSQHANLPAIRNGRIHSGSGAGPAGSGGSGIVAIRHIKKARNKLLTTTGSPTMIEYDGYIYYVWTSSGSVTF